LLRDRGHGWDHLGVLLSLVYRLLRCLSGLLAVLVRADLSKDVELLVLPPQSRAPHERAIKAWNHSRATQETGGPLSRETTHQEPKSLKRSIYIIPAMPSL
jgi:hypothetical protein